MTSTVTSKTRTPLTHEEYVRRVAILFDNRVEVAEAYAGAQSKIAHRCRLHGLWRARPSNIQAGFGCPRCAAALRANTAAMHTERVHVAHGDSIEVVGTYESANKQIMYRCLMHGVFIARPANVERGHGCRRCYNARVSERQRKAPGVYTSEAARRGFVVLDVYAGATVPLRHRCAAEHVFSSRPSDILSGYGCTFCNRSQYRRRAITVGDRMVLVQGVEDKAVAILLAEHTAPEDIAFTTIEGKPTVRYYDGVMLRRYVPDFYIRSKNEIVEVKSPTTLGLYDAALFAINRRKARACIAAGFAFRLVLIHRGRELRLSSAWPTFSYSRFAAHLARRSHAQDRRY